MTLALRKSRATRVRVRACGAVHLAGVRVGTPSPSRVHTALHAVFAAGLPYGEVPGVDDRAVRIG
ncbi:hypothetical protein Busp01_14790 [Trinickia caryophylli]|nr:hypothetical protein Busp01_14790 [Trinickia caryophylli]